MKRRDFLTAAGAASVAAWGMPSARAATGEPRQFIELREYEMMLGGGKKRLQNFIEKAAIPAWNRLGIQPVGVFTPRYGQNRPTLYVLLPHPTLESVATLNDRMVEDETFLRDGAEFLNTELSNPGYVRIDSTLMRAFSHLPKVQAVTEAKTRIFEMRIYESHSLLKAKKKIHMFNEGGEIAIFKKTGLNPVFFGETLIGPRMPNLTYMLGFDNMDQRDKNWDQFRNSPEWDELKVKPEYSDTVSNITDIILAPTSFSQI
ncbi:NIPSNAP family containing protein [candidate division KSB1 bacterium]|jgi:hypothetical protein|nr:NIPSNAP family containing protein [candidate division KSB1 bacterium]